MTQAQTIDTNLSEVFGTDPMVLMPIDVPVPVEPKKGTDEEIVDSDVDFARSNAYDLLNKGNEALIYALQLAKSSENPRAYEVFATLLKNLGDINQQVLDVQEKKQKLKPKKPEEQHPDKVVNNTIVFNGTTAEMNKVLENMRKENK